MIILQKISITYTESAVFIVVYFQTSMTEWVISFINYGVEDTALSHS